MSDSLQAFAEWSASVRDSLPVNATMKVVQSEGSVFIDIEEVGGSLGRLTYWADGTADASVFDSTGELVDLQAQIIELGGWHHVSSSDFGKAFAPFLAQFSRSGR